MSKPRPKTMLKNTCHAAGPSSRNHLPQTTLRDARSQVFEFFSFLTAIGLACPWFGQRLLMLFYFEDTDGMKYFSAASCWR